MKFGDQISLIFTKVVDAGTLGLDDEEEEVQAVTDRTYWETERGTKETVALADEMLNLIKTFAPERELRYNRYYVGLGKDEQPNNFAVFFPKRSSFQTNIYLKSSPEIDRQLEAAGIDVMDYDKRGEDIACVSPKATSALGTPGRAAEDGGWAGGGVAGRNEMRNLESSWHPWQNEDPFAVVFSCVLTIEACDMNPRLPHACSSAILAP